MRQTRMADTAIATPDAPASSDAPKKIAKKAPATKKTAVAKTPKVKAPKVTKKATTHPKISIMVDDAIKGLGERGGSSLKAIKKYILTKYKVDVEKLAPFIRRYLKSGVKSGSIVQAKGKGANGSFKLPHKGGAAKAPSTAPAKPKKNIAAKKAKTSPKVKVTGAKTKKESIGGTAAKKALPPKPKKMTTTKKVAVKKVTKAKSAVKAPKPKQVATKKPVPRKAPSRK